LEANPVKRGLSHALVTMSIVLTGLAQPWAHADIAGPANADFESADLSGWQVVSGDAFSVTDATTYWGGAFNQHGPHFLSGFIGHGDDATGEVRSSTFRLDSDAVSFLISGGWNPDRLYVALVRASDGKVLVRQSGMDDEALVRITWDTRRWRGQDVYFSVVDTATGGWGHINADDFRVADATRADNGLTVNRLGQQNQPVVSDPAASDYAADPLRPQFHYTPYQGWINDPNGLIQWNGRHQLFSQFNPAAPKWGPMHWAHADSPDAVHWRNLPVALAPPPAAPGDVSGIFTGNAVNDHGTLTALYTIFTDTSAHPGATPETVGLATSTDGIRFTPHAGNPVISAPPAAAEAGFRDPYAFRDPTDGLWKLVVGSGHDGHGRAQLYSSPDLRTWTYLGVLAEGDGSTGAMWECPNLFPLGNSGKWVLLVSANNTDYAYVGTYDGRHFTADKVSRLDAGPDLYAAQHYRDASGRDLLIGWMDNWNAKEPTRVNGWAGAQTITRELFLKADGTVGSRPVAQVDGLHIGTPQTVRATEVTTAKMLASGDTLDLRATIDLKHSTATGFSMRLRSSTAEGAELRYDLATHLLTLDTTNAGYGSGGTWSTTVPPDQNGLLNLRILIDRSSLEVFTGDGTALTARVYPRYQASDQITLNATGGTVHLLNARSWQMGPTWSH
jgi:sucrose-6-phosphate hydrolase SacC (GH32 family)